MLEERKFAKDGEILPWKHMSIMAVDPILQRGGI